jgi:hypothetical protein
LKFLHLFHKEAEFGNIEGYDDIKDIARRALWAEDNYNLLFIGPPACAKTLFLLGILQRRKGVYFDGSNTTNRILDVLEKVLSKVSPSIARYIGAAVWKNQGDIRDVISIGKLVRKNDGPYEIEQIINTMVKYGNSI